MDIQMLSQIITSVGFPIVACGALFWYQCNLITKFTEAMNNNTIAITKLSEKLDSQL